ncbi:MAG: hypothetical protein HYW49_05695 [Deltaproteobacteria bacterium]|nr:hypothetical protein [Deltaproteobacteria bacterium]
MNSRRSLILTYVFVSLAFLWSLLWGKSADHRLGDASLTRWYHHAAEYFADHGLQSYGLPVYPPDQPPYTHITPGPDWIQTIYAALHRLAPFRDFPVFRWNSILTAIATLAGMFAALAMLARITSAVIGEANGMENARRIDSARKAVTLLFLSSAMIQVFSPHPHCSAVMLLDAFSLFCVAWWAEHATRKYAERSWLKAQGLFATAVFIAFWMGLSPTPAVMLWSLAAAYRFGDTSLRGRRLLSLSLVIAAVLAFAVALKLYQNYLYLGSIDAVLKDVADILKTRQGVAENTEYSVLLHLAKIPWRVFYLFGALGFFALGFALKTPALFKKERVLVSMILAAGLIWQLLMRQHGFHHLYFLQTLFMPLGLTLMLGLSSSEAVSRIARWIPAAAMLQAALLWSVALIPSLR